MTRWVMVVVGLAGCGSKSTPHAGGEIAGCDATHPPTAEAVYAQYLAEGGTSLPAAPRGVEVDDSPKHPALYRVSFDPGPDQGHPQLGDVWRCRLYREANKLATAIVLDGGWASAAPDKRVPLATETAGMAFGRPELVKVARWDDTHPFTAPAATAQPDGGVKLVEWHYQPEPISYEAGEVKEVYALVEITFAKDGTVAVPTRRDSFTLLPKDAPPPATAPPKPATGSGSAVK